ncbi:MAG: hypothetical protein IE936_09180 [Moraxella osloensis]|nr:hypothetical protein [Moraxella osloensis]
METHSAIKIVLTIGGLWVLLVALSANGLTAASPLWWVIGLTVGAFVLFVLFGDLARRRAGDDRLIKPSVPILTDLKL